MGKQNLPRTGNNNKDGRPKQSPYTIAKINENVTVRMKNKNMEDTINHSKTKSFPQY